MLIPLEEFRSNLDKYMKIARIKDIYITDESKQTTWILTSVKENWWAESVFPLFNALQ